MYFSDWDRLIRKHFAAHEYELFVPDRGWGEKLVKKLGRYADAERSWKTSAKWLGGTLSAFCRKAGTSEPRKLDRFEDFLRCPDCHSAITRIWAWV